MTDPYIGLEETNEETLEWVTNHSGQTLAAFSGRRFDSLENDLHNILAAKDSLIIGTKKGDYVYNFYTDGDYPRGLWRRTPAHAYMTYRSADTEPDWEILLDIGALGKEEGQSWVFAGARLLRPDYTRALITLSPGGSDADVTREFDIPTRTFVPESDGGFVRSESKGSMGWIDRDTVVITSDFSAADDAGPATSKCAYVTESGYPRSARIWKRGTSLADAPQIIEGDVKDVLAGASFDTTPGYERLYAYRATDFRTTILFLADPETLELSEVLLPRSAEVDLWHNWAIAELRHDWTLADDGSSPTASSRTFTAGSLLAIPVEAALAGPTASDVHVIYEPTPTSSLLSATSVKSGLVFTTLDNVHNRVFYAEETGTGWQIHNLNPDLADHQTISIAAVEPDVSDDVWVTTTGFVTPTTLFHGRVSEVGLDITKLRSAPERFDASGIEVRQRWATSDDGTKVPYFVVGTASALDGAEAARTLLDGYGGFEVSRLPAYISTYGKAWLEKGNVYALANIRGGGEFGPAWHQAALKENRNRAYEDFAAVARDLVDAGITTVPQLAAIGGSNGGLLMGNMYTTYPELFGAIVCRVPLLDMKRYSHLLAGASWIGEYGDPDTDDWEYMEQYSAYHNVRPGGHPPILLTSSTRDDRVHPGHGRKMKALLDEMGLEAYYYENTEGGHAGAADLEQQARVLALIFSFLDAKLA